MGSSTAAGRQRDSAPLTGHACFMKANDGRIGIFRARVTRDAEARARDGQPYFAMNRLTESQPELERGLFEIQFGDGLWMLAREDDLVTGIIGD